LTHTPCPAPAWPPSVGKDPALSQAAVWVGIDLALLWLWCRLAAIALIQPLAWELPYATGVALKRQKKIFKYC